MANLFRSVLASARAILQSKTVTAGTSAQTVTPDSGYDGLESVTVNPTPSQSKSATPTTSAQTITPDSGKLLSQVDIAPIPSEYKIPTQIMPGNTPGAMTAGEAYSPTQNAYIIDAYTSITPNNTSPAPIYSGMIKSEGSGYAISSYSSTSKTPSSTGTYFSSGWNRMTSSGYAYSSQQPKIAKGAVTISTSGSTTVNLGFKPKYLSTITYMSDTAAVFCVYDSDISISSEYRGAINGSTTTAQRLTFPVAYSSSTRAAINSLTDTGFIMNQSIATYGTYCYYFAIG